MKVLLTHGYFLSEDVKEQKIMRPYPPLGILYISSYLNQHGVDNEVFDTTFETRETQLRVICEVKPEVLAVYTNLMTKVRVIQIIRDVKVQSPGTTIVLGGPDVTFNTSEYLGSGADILVIGEGEQTMLELVRALAKESPDLSKVAGISFLLDSQQIKTAPRPKIKEIDSLPLPNRAAIDISKYLEAWRSFHGMNALNVSTQRGCPYTCKWCSTAVYGQSYRRRSPEKVVEEIALIQKEYAPDTIWFVDDVFTISHKWLQAFAEQLARKKVKVKFECISRADRMNPEVIRTLKQAGCFRIWIGAESGSQRVIDAMDRRVKVDQVREVIRQTKAQGVEAGTFIMLGYPGETESDIIETIRHLTISQPDHFTITLAYPIKGTALYHQVEPLLTTKPEWETSTDRDLDFKRTYPRRYYRFALSKVINEVNYQKQRQAEGLGLRAIKLRSQSMLATIGMKITSALG